MKTRSRPFVSLAGLLAGLSMMLVPLAGARAQSAADYPQRPIRLVVGFTAGGISDVLARALAVRLSAGLGQQVIVENRAGAGTTIASDLVAKAAPDGYTLYVQDITTHAINASLYPKLPYDTLRDFTPVALFASSPLMLVTHPGTGVHSLSELTAMLRSKPGAYSYGSSGNGTITHLAGELYRSLAGVEVAHVPYKGSTPTTQAILGGEVAFTFSSMPPAVQNAKAGRLRALAVTTPRRVEAVPEVPTMREAGMADYEIVLYSGVLAPRGLPEPILKRLNAEMARVVAHDDIRSVFASVGADAITTTPEAFAALLAREVERLGRIVRASGAKVE
jgi:tripartite-type tricarboxylate transporter receptor subunit TctC